MPDLTDVFVYVAVFGFFFLFLRSLIALAKQDLNRPRKLPKSNDEFLKSNGYTYDYVMVFKIYDEEFKKRMNPYQKKYSMKSVVDRIQFAGLRKFILSYHIINTDFYKENSVIFHHCK